MKLSSNNLPETVSCPTSKSYAARALILSALKEEPIKIINMPNALDTKDLLVCLEKIGLVIDKSLDCINISESFPACELASSTSVKLATGEGGTTTRFLLPLLALGKNSYELSFQGEMINRPMLELYTALRALGVRVEESSNGVLIQGPIDFNKKIKLDCKKTSQFASSFELLKFKYDLNIEYENLNSSLKYFELTKSLVSRFKDLVSFEIPADASSLAYFVVYAVLNQDLRITNIKRVDPLQADSYLFDILDQLKVKYTLNENGLHIFKQDEFAAGLNLDGSRCIDLVPTLIFLASCLAFESKFTNIKNLKYKESNRLRETFKILEQVKIKFSYSEESDELIIFGNKDSTQDLHIATAKDHRMIMLGSLFVKHHGGGSITPYKDVAKSFPDFFNFFN